MTKTAPLFFSNKILFENWMDHRGFPWLIASQQFDPNCNFHTKFSAFLMFVKVLHSADTKFQDMRPACLEASGKRTSTQRGAYWNYNYGGPMWIIWTTFNKTNMTCAFLDQIEVGAETMLSAGVYLLTGIDKTNELIFLFHWCRMLLCQDLCGYICTCVCRYKL